MTQTTLTRTRVQAIHVQTSAHELFLRVGFANRHLFEVRRIGEARRMPGVQADGWILAGTEKSELDRAGSGNGIALILDGRSDLVFLSWEDLREAASQEDRDLAEFYGMIESVGGDATKKATAARKQQFAETWGKFYRDAEWLQQDQLNR